ncbi:MAG: OmpH family outer membrane protein [Spirochaetales bacterium]|nr:OmpH family outer membrane protein [Spirochaetales bacterium]
MKQSKRTLAFLVMMTLIAAPSVFAQQITKVAVLDYSRILSAFYADSSEARRIEDMKESFAEEVKALQEEIQDLEERKLAAGERGDSRSELELDGRIQEKTQYYQQYVRVKGNQIREAQANLGSSTALASEILQAIQYIAESNGYSLVLKRSDPNLLWWSYEVDITDKVLKRLMDGR